MLDRTPSSNPNLFISGIFECKHCFHESRIFISKDYNLYGICEPDTVCVNCKQIKSMVCSGDLIYRADWPDPDDDPWQLQCCYIDQHLYYCVDCKPYFEGTFRDLKPVCPHCENEMRFKL
jgi:DNA-directed RNA polymerase subunit RPC12/RpoP